MTLPTATPSLHLNSRAATGGAERGVSCKRQLGATAGTTFLLQSLSQAEVFNRAVASKEHLQRHFPGL